MTVINRQKDALPASISLDELGKAMSGLDLASIPPEKRARAVMDRLAGVMIDTIHDRSVAADLLAARLYRSRLP